VKRRVRIVGVKGEVAVEVDGDFYELMLVNPKGQSGDIVPEWGRGSYKRGRWLLAHSMILTATGCDRLAEMCYREFAEKVVKTMPTDRPWRIPVNAIISTVDQMEARYRDHG